ncbi:thioredoxin-like protein [Rhodocollybia butyracea]|uniref:Thioredoxin-like protein n=1 Tax=Rhodocollybia butyracea TaxID=206335 RepID=A0A9P5PQW8_9AGAR|nr:thioredoxin-like protein [Rhodocollybia butyracea]
MSSTLASAAIFPKDSTVKMLDPKGFRKAMKANQTCMVAFVAPWCGHCQRMVPEYSKAASGLHPLIPTYAVDCDADANKPLCAEQGVKGFPTLFPRGKELNPMTYESGERTAGAFFKWASNRVPNHVKKLGRLDNIHTWVEDSAKRGLPRALLLTKDTKNPLLWKVLGNKYTGQIELASHIDVKGASSEALGYEAGSEKSSKVLVYAPGSTSPVRYQGVTKLDAISKFFDSVIDGTAELQPDNVTSEPAEPEPASAPKDEL